MNFWNAFHGPNAGYVLELYERYRQDSRQVDEATRAFFEQLTPEELAQIEHAARMELLEQFEPAPPRAGAPQPVGQAGAGQASALKIAAASQLAQNIRFYGHLDAQLDPLGSPPPGDPLLRLETYSLTEDDLRTISADVVGGIAGRIAAQQGGTALEAIQYLRKVYSSNIGFDYLQNRDPEERRWLREAAESGRFSAEQEPVDPLRLLERLNQVETFEHFLQRSFVGKTRFSIEGLDMMVPMLDQLLASATGAGIFNILIGMAHRGRLNVLVHVLNKPVDQILAEFRDPLRRRGMQNEPLGWTGDVKYHAGAQRVVGEEPGVDTVNLSICMAPNPSHLEAINPVVEGMARAAGTNAERPGKAEFDPSITLPILIHGDAGFPGQGVVAETLNLYQLEGYTTGGTIHIIANNQIGFTADPGETRSTLFASDLAKGFRMPIIHVNADDPEACILAVRTAFAYRAQFHRDFVIDLIGYRRLGHNEGDEPAFTQPKMYEKIRQHPSVRKLWADRLIERGVVEPDLPDRLYQQRINELQSALDNLDPEILEEPLPAPAPPGAARSVQTRVSSEQLKRLNRELTTLPDGFNLHPRLARIRQRRMWHEQQDDSGEPPGIDWATAEELAFATILEEGVPIRITGQDVERGTFSHRHAVLRDVNTGEVYTPLQSLPQAKAAFEIFNSPLSEYAALGFEFGYNIQSGSRLVIWEAQYGDFINNAQAVVDEFIVSARDKWGQLPSLVILLPHGYEGQGPDHSSGRLERFLSMTVDNNLRVANCTTAAQYFHLLRRQAALLRVDPLPLVVMTPKSLLRHPLTISPLAAFTDGGWQPVIDRQPVPGEQELPPAETVRRMVLCSGKVYADLVSSELHAAHPETGKARVEQLAPFPTHEVRELLESYPDLEEVVWVQEEPENMGAWDFVRPYLEEITNGRWALGKVARPRSASPAEGSSNVHAYNQKQLIEQAYEEKVRNHGS